MRNKVDDRIGTLINNGVKTRHRSMFVMIGDKSRDQISDLKLPLADLYFLQKLPVTLSYVQASVLLCMGLQNQDVSYAEGTMKLERQQILSLYLKVMKKLHKYLEDMASKEIGSTLPPQKEESIEV